MGINELFTVATVSTKIDSARNLPGTAQLTSLSETIARSIVEQMNADAENYTARIQQSTKDADELFALIAELSHDFTDDAAFLTELDESVVDGMLKSQQSKRSRTKGKQMTLDNYMTMMSAAVAEHIIRTVLNKPKAAVAHRNGSIDYTVEQLEKFSDNQEQLKREIRNVQSKKSIMKSKADFDESDERWLALLKAEQMLKDLRTTTTVVHVDETKNAVNDVLADVDLSKLKADEARELLAKIADLAQQ